MPTTPTTPLPHCYLCGAPPGQPCRNTVTGRLLPLPHLTRGWSADEQAEGARR